MPISKGMINCAIYDSKNNLMTHNEILSGDKAVCVLQLSGLKFLKQQVICEWTPLQIKVFKQSKDNVKGYLIDDSLLSDDEYDNSFNNISEQLTEENINITDKTYFK